MARQGSTALRRHLSDEALLVHIRAVHTRTKRACGRPCIWRELRKDGVRVGRQRLQTSMSRRVKCGDNACSETLFGSLKVERLHGQRFITRRHAKDETLAWLFWYNQSR